MGLVTYNTWNSYLSARGIACKAHQPLTVSAARLRWWQCLLTAMFIILIYRWPLRGLTSDWLSGEDLLLVEKKTV